MRLRPALLAAVLVCAAARLALAGGEDGAAGGIGVPANCQCSSEHGAYRAAEDRLEAALAAEHEVLQRHKAYVARQDADFNGQEYRSLVREMEAARASAGQAKAQYDAASQRLKSAVGAARERARNEEAKLEAERKKLETPLTGTDPDPQRQREREQRMAQLNDLIRKAKDDQEDARAVEADLDKDADAQGGVARGNEQTSSEQLAAAGQNLVTHPPEPPGAGAGTGAGSGAPGPYRGNYGGVPRPPGADSGNPEAQRRYLDDVLKRQPNNVAALKELAVANADAGRRAEACAAAQNASSAAPGDAHASGMVRLLCGAGVMDKASLQRLMQAKARRPGAQPDGARPDGLQPQANRSPAPPGGLNAAGPAAPADLGRPDLLRSGAGPSGAQALAGDAHAAIRGGDFRGAMSAALQAIRLDPGDPRNYRLYASAAKAARSYRKALDGADAGLRVKPGDPALLNLKSFAQGRLKDYPGAKESALEALRVNPTDATALANLAWALAGLGDRDGMLDALRRAAALDPRFADSLQTALDGTGDADLFFLFPGEQGPASKEQPVDWPRRLALLSVAGLAALALLAFGLARKEARESVEAAAAPQAAPAAAAPESPTRGAESPTRGAGAPQEALEGLLARRYELRGRLGEGGMGVVLDAFDRSLGRRVAIKKMRPELSASPEDRARFIREARLISRLGHPFIVSIHDIFEQEGELYLVFDYVDGKPLSAILRERGRLPLAECQRILEQVCQAVAHAHERKIMHRDLKPANIMVDAAGYARVMDFGLAREAKDTLSRATQQTIAGTPAYMPPEQHLGAAGPPADVYALGVCLYEMLCGRSPFLDGDLLAQKQRMQFLPPRSVVPSLPKGVDSLVAAALEADPAKRTSGPLELLRSLKSLS